MRRTGRTTRIVDKTIQELFKDGEVIVSDHYVDGNQRQANERVFHLVMERFTREHGSHVSVYADVRTLTIKLLNR